MKLWCTIARAFIHSAFAYKFRFRSAFFLARFFEFSCATSHDMTNGANGNGQTIEQMRQRGGGGGVRLVWKQCDTRNATCVLKLPGRTLTRPLQIFIHDARTAEHINLLGLAYSLVWTRAANFMWLFFAQASAQTHYRTIWLIIEELFRPLIPFWREKSWAIDTYAFL